MIVNGTSGTAARLRVARAAAARRYPYFAPVLYRMTLIESAALETAAISRQLHLYLNPAWAQTLSNAELLGVLLHEALHWLRDHPGARGERQLARLQRDDAALLWNIAADLEVNDDLIALGHRLPEPLLPAHFGWDDHLLAEVYLARLLTLPAPAALRLRDLAVPMELAEAATREAPGIAPLAGEALRHQVACEIAQQPPGKVPAGLRRWAQARLQPKVRWQGLLRRALGQGLLCLRQRRYPSYQLPHRRAAALSPFVLPGSYGRQPHVAVIIDTSGSISNAMLAQAAAEVRDMLRSGARLTVYAVDAAVQLAQRLFRPEQLALRGGGGTDMGAGLAAALAAGFRLIVVLTDGYTPWPARPPSARVIVGLLGDGPPPPSWAQVVRIR